MTKRPLPPVGFWSYARPDDELSGGQLSRLRALVRAELQQQYGREPIQLFQDISAISHGSRWEGEIRRALENSTFFIPILSPNFLQSEWCVQEVEIFRERQERLFDAHPDMPRKSRIFPIHYIDVHGIDSLRPDVDQALRELQWFDFRDFRHHDFSGPEVRRTVSGFVTSVRDLLRVQVEQEDGAPPPAPPRANPAAPLTDASGDPLQSPAPAAPTPGATGAPLGDGPIPAGPPGAGGRGSKMPLIAGGLVALLVAAALVYFLVIRRDAGDQVAGGASQSPVAVNSADAAGNAAEPTLEESEAEYTQAMVGRWGDNAQCSDMVWDLREDGSYEGAVPGRWSISVDRLRIEDAEGIWQPTIELLDEAGQRIRLTAPDQDPQTWYRCPA